MKKLLLSLFLGSALCANAQDVIWSDDFNDEDISDWILVDADEDGRDWSVVQIVDAEGNPVNTPLLRSASWATVALTPDNWAVSPMIDLSNYPSGSTVTLDWSVMAIDASWDLEKYSVYVGTVNDVFALVDSPVTMTENSLGGVNELTPRTLNISELAGAPEVYVAFRHYDTSDQFTMEIDDVSVTGTALSTDSFFANNFRMYPNPASSVINLSGIQNELQSVQLTDINGRVVKNIALNGIAETQINVSDLTSGVYFLKVQSALGTGTAKVIKN